ncbi:peptidase M16 [Actinorhabdospora filicis]|uniref:Peptidase M16 n=1 Tax=Actinorhabdospora filicis TaxID=1785913 RepID=A0A9W6SJ49_9ACTN|nr:pitrilysin family protein [Actinorhabdospora filicis]GLZ75611.1 peptidase M16 [Actinorhabdospora filicis]
MSDAQTRTVADDPLGGTVLRTVLPGGLRIITESIPAMRSASIGVWVGIGSRDESEEFSGASHFLEHLLFKGTERRDALDITAEIEAVGGDTNAFTAKDHTCFYARVLDEDLPLAVDVLGDIICDSLLDEEDVETERGVILEEIAMHDDEPDDAVHDMLATAVFGDHPLGREISGTVQTITVMTRGRVNDFYRERYTAPNMVIAAAGNLGHQHVVDLVERAFAPLLKQDADPAPIRSAFDPVADLGPVVNVVRKDTEQAHLVLGCRALPRRDERRFALEVLTQVLGGGMSSLLFQRIREERGLAYSVYAYTAAYAETGLFGVYAGCAPGKAREVLELIRQTLDEVAGGGCDAEQVARAKGALKGSMVLAMEDTSSRMSRLGKGELLFGDLLSLDELLARVDAVTVADVCAVAGEVLGRPRSLAAIGPFDDAFFDGSDV